MPGLVNHGEGCFSHQWEKELIIAVYFKTMGEAFPWPWASTKGPTGSGPEDLSLFCYLGSAQESQDCILFLYQFLGQSKKMEPTSLGRNGIRDKAYHISYVNPGPQPLGKLSLKPPSGNALVFLLLLRSWNQNCVYCLNCLPLSCLSSSSTTPLTVGSDHITFLVPMGVLCQVHQIPTVQIVHFCIFSGNFACAEIEFSTY